MKLTMHTTISFVNDEKGYRFAKGWCERRSRQGVRYKMSEMETGIILEDWCDLTVNVDEEDE